MELFSLANIKKELKEQSPDALVEYCLRMAKYRKENKELLNYLLFEAHDEENYKSEVKAEMDLLFSDINLSSVYYAKKTIRKILRHVVKHIKYSGSKQTEIELLIYFCENMRQLSLPYQKSKVLINLYNRQIQNILKSMSKLDEDLQFDYQEDFKSVNQPLSNLNAY